METQERSPDDGALPSLCLKQVYPKYAKQFNHLRLVERIAGLFIRFLGVKGNMRLGPTAFRTFIRYGLTGWPWRAVSALPRLTPAFTPAYRSCKLSNSNFTMAAVDILYIDITRRWCSADAREAGDTAQEHSETKQKKRQADSRKEGRGQTSFCRPSAGLAEG